VICVDPAPPVTEAGADGADLRTTAFLQPSIPVLQGAGLWSRLEPHAAALQVMRIIDAGGPEPEARLTKDFDAADISDAALRLEPAELAAAPRDGGAAGRPAECQLPPRAPALPAC
jgi:2-polyprenyl-6-methoxyphenol hydroxylase-like FAD-dependent oxidoreductase